MAWVVRDGQTTCATAWPWPAAPTRCPTPSPSGMSTYREYRRARWLPTIPAMREIEKAQRMAERSSDDIASVANARVTLGLALVHRHTDAERDRGQQLLAEVSEVFCAGDTT